MCQYTMINYNLDMFPQLVKLALAGLCQVAQYQINSNYFAFKLQFHI